MVVPREILKPAGLALSAAAVSWKVGTWTFKKVLGPLATVPQGEVLARPGRLIGGPLDGGELAPQRREFVWVADRGDKYIAYAAPRADRALYRKDCGASLKPVERIRRADYESFFFAGNTHALCTGCEQFNEIGEGETNLRCEFCSSPLTKPSDLTRTRAA